MPRPKFPESKCLTPDCEGTFGGDNMNKGGRGLCKPCHQAASTMVRKGKATWEELESLGLAQPKYTGQYERAVDLARKKKKVEMRDTNNIPGRRINACDQQTDAAESTDTRATGERRLDTVDGGSGSTDQGAVR